MGIPTDDEIMSGIRRAIGDALKARGSDITTATHFRRDLQADSLDMVTLVIAIEEEFGVASMPEASLEQIATVGDAFEVVRKTLASRQP